MGPSKDTFALCAALMFTAMCVMFMATGTPWVRGLGALALYGGVLSQWIAQDSGPGMWIASRVLAWVAAFLTLVAMAAYLPVT